MPTPNSPEIIQFIDDMTLRWPCRRGDVLLWFAQAGLLGGPRIADLWGMRDGCHVTITNRLEDLPSWFQLYPTEAAGRLIAPMLDRLDKGYKPRAPVDGPNLWRLKTGDRVAWIGSDRPGRTAVNRILAIVDCSACALAVVEGISGTLADFAGFGAPASQRLSPENAAAAGAAAEAIRQLGVPRSWETDWRLG